MLFTIVYDWNGTHGQRQERADTEEEALRLFDEHWTRHGQEPPPPEARWVTERWSEK